MSPAQAVAAAYDAHAPSLYRALRRLGVPEDAVQDAVQDVFLVAFRKHTEFEGRSSYRTWLYGIALRVARDYRRERDRRTRESTVELHDGGASPEARTEQALALQRLDALLSSMSEPLRETFVLLEIEQLRAKEAAELLQVPLNTVYSRLRLAREQILDSMREQSPLAGVLP